MARSALWLLPFMLLPATALADGTVACDARVKRIVTNLRHEPMSPDQAERARLALYDAIDRCRPLTTTRHGGSPAPAQSRSGGAPMPSTTLERQSWRAQQNSLSPAERREGEARLDAIDRKARSDPQAARDMQRIWEADRSLNTINRATPGGAASPSLSGPGDRN